MQVQLERTLDQFTSGIVNLPIFFDNEGKPLQYVDEKSKRLKYKVVPDMRYPFFELDTTSHMHVKKIINQYNNHDIPFYMHRTMRGWHFLSILPIHKDWYAEWINPIMRFNKKCPMVTLRCKANKWIGEKDIWKTGEIQIKDNCQDYAVQKSALYSLRQMISNQMLGLLHNNYYLVHYRMTGELGNL